MEKKTVNKRRRERLDRKNRRTKRERKHIKKEKILQANYLKK